MEVVWGAVVGREGGDEGSGCGWREGGREGGKRSEFCFFSVSGIGFLGFLCFRLG